MKVNSNTIKLEKESYEKLEEVIKKIASDNKINNIKNVEIRLSKESGVVKFAIEESYKEKKQIAKNAILDYAKTVWEEHERVGSSLRLDALLEVLIKEVKEEFDLPYDNF